jgi:hypothetical protein
MCSFHAYSWNDAVRLWPVRWSVQNGEFRSSFPYDFKFCLCTQNTATPELEHSHGGTSDSVPGDFKWGSCGRSGSGADFSPSFLFFNANHHSTIALYASNTAIALTRQHIITSKFEVHLWPGIWLVIEGGGKFYCPRYDFQIKVTGKITIRRLRVILLLTRATFSNVEHSREDAMLPRRENWK